MNYLVKAHIKSFRDPSKKYTIRRREDGTYSCSCPAYTFYVTPKYNKHGGAERYCKHIQHIEGATDPLEKMLLSADKYILEIDGDKWEVSDDNK